RSRPRDRLCTARLNLVDHEDGRRTAESNEGNRAASLDGFVARDCWRQLVDTTLTSADCRTLVHVSQHRVLRASSDPRAVGELGALAYAEARQPRSAVRAGSLSTVSGLHRTGDQPLAARH